MQKGPGFDKPYYTRIRNLSYKPKFAKEFADFRKSYSIELFRSNAAKTGAAAVLSTAVSNLVSEAIK